MGKVSPRATTPMWREEYAKHSDMTGQLTISHGMCVPMLNEYGTDEQKAQYLPDAIAGQDRLVPDVFGAGGRV